jgi:hypothetical protein
MRKTYFETNSRIALILAVVISASLIAMAQTRLRPQQATPKLTAVLVDAENKAKKQAATVDVKVTGIALTDPAKVNEQPKPGQGHLHYQVDGGPIIATTTTKLSFHGLTSGQHKIVVMLAANDHTPLGPQETLTVTIP